MNYVRFSGEWFIYYTLIALGGGALMGLTIFIFKAIGLDAERALVGWVLPCGAMGAVIIGAWLVEHKQSVIENMAPVLTWLFTPLFTALLLVFVVAMIWTGNAINVGREVLIGFDLLLVVVLGLLLYAISARDPQAPPGRFDGLQLLLVASRPHRGRSRPVGDGRAHLRIRVQPQQDGGARLEPAAAREPGLVGRALRALPRPDAPRSRASSAGRRPTCRRSRSGRGS